VSSIRQSLERVAFGFFFSSRSNSAGGTFSSWIIKVQWEFFFAHLVALAGGEHFCAAAGVALAKHSMLGMPTSDTTGLRSIVSYYSGAQEAGSDPFSGSDQPFVGRR
jgi:hypothetical protein